MNVNSLKYIIIEDNEVDALMLQVFAQKHKTLEYAGTFTNALDGLNAIIALQPDLVFLDIEMPMGSGLELLRSVKNIVPLTVFVSSHGEFALEGFELTAFDFILKPATEERFHNTIMRIEEYWEMKQKAAAYTIHFEQEMITIKQGHEQLRIPLQEIIYLEAMGDYTKLFTTHARYMTLVALSQFLEQLPSSHFSRIHRSYAVANSKIKKLGTDEISVEGYTLPIGKTYRKTIKSLVI